MHFDDLQLLLNNHSSKEFSVVGLTETWLSHDSNLPFSLDAYNFVFNNRQDRSGGGVAIYLLKTLPSFIFKHCGFVFQLFLLLKWHHCGYIDELGNL